MKQTKSELETVIRWDEETEQAVIWSASSRFHRYMARRGITAYREDKRGGRFYRVPKSWVTVRPPRQVSTETKARLAQNARFLSRRTLSERVSGPHLSEQGGETTYTQGGRPETRQFTVEEEEAR